MNHTTRNVYPLVTPVAIQVTTWLRIGLDHYLDVVIYENCVEDDVNNNRIHCAVYSYLLQMRDYCFFRAITIGLVWPPSMSAVECDQGIGRWYSNHPYVFLQFFRRSRRDIRCCISDVVSRDYDKGNGRLYSNHLCVCCNVSKEEADDIWGSVYLYKLCCMYARTFR